MDGNEQGSSCWSRTSISFAGWSPSSCAARASRSSRPPTAEAVESIREPGPFDVVLLDLNLPVLSGVEVCRRIKGEPVAAGHHLQRGDP